MEFLNATINLNQDSPWFQWIWGQDLLYPASLLDFSFSVIGIVGKNLDTSWIILHTGIQFSLKQTSLHFPQDLYSQQLFLLKFFNSISILYNILGSSHKAMTFKEHDKTKLQKWMCVVLAERDLSFPEVPYWISYSQQKTLFITYCLINNALML